MLTKAEQRFICEQLELYHCSAREVEIYIESLRLGAASVQDLANSLAQNRITIHSATANLVKKGLLYEARRGKRRLLMAEDPQALARLFQIRENELESARANLGYVVKLLHRVQRPNAARPYVQFYQGVEGFKRMLELTLTAKNEFLGMINVDLFSEHLSPAYLEDYFARRAECGINSRLIWPRRGTFSKRIAAREKAYRIQIRFLSAETNWSSGFISWNDCLSLKSFSAGQITCTIIQNKDIVSFYRSDVFERLWGIAERVS